MELRWTGTRRRAGEDHEEVILQTNESGIQCRLHLPEPESRSSGVVWVGGAGGGLDGPAGGLYPAACRGLMELGVAGLRLHYRHPNLLQDCVLDTLLAVEFLKAEGFSRVALVGHSFGGAVVITAGALSLEVLCVVAMSTQTYGTDLVPKLTPRKLLLIHGTEDEILPDDCSRQVFHQAKEPKQLKLYPGAGHGLDESREELLGFLIAWLSENLGDDPPISAKSAAKKQVSS